jgi:hypothetical protein
MNERRNMQQWIDSEKKSAENKHSLVARATKMLCAQCGDLKNVRDRQKDGKVLLECNHMRAI